MDGIFAGLPWADARRRDGAQQHPAHHFAALRRRLQPGIEKHLVAHRFAQPARIERGMIRPAGIPPPVVARIQRRAVRVRHSFHRVIMNAVITHNRRLLKSPFAVQSSTGRAVKFTVLQNHRRRVDSPTSAQMQVGRCVRSAPVCNFTVAQDQRDILIPGIDPHPGAWRFIDAGQHDRPFSAAQCVERTAILHQHSLIGRKMQLNAGQDGKKTIRRDHDIVGNLHRDAHVSQVPLPPVHRTARQHQHIAAVAAGGDMMGHDRAITVPGDRRAEIIGDRQVLQYRVNAAVIALEADAPAAPLLAARRDSIPADRHIAQGRIDGAARSGAHHPGKAIAADAAPLHTHRYGAAVPGIQVKPGAPIIRDIYIFQNGRNTAAV